MNRLLKRFSVGTSFLSLSCALTLSLLGSSHASVRAQEETTTEPDGSMDSMWEEGNKANEAKKTTAPGKNAPLDDASRSQPSVPAQASQSRQDLMDAMSSPLCQVSNFKESELVKTTCWPGVGPFKADGASNELTDPQDNKLSVQSDGDKLTSAQLLLVGQSQDAQGILNLEMVSDFMLEALGLKGKRITEFNTYLEKNKEILTSESKFKGAALSTASGPYVISLKGAGGSTPAYLIEVHSKSLSPDQVKSHDLTALLNNSTAAPTGTDNGGEDEPAVTPVKPTKPQTQSTTIKKPPVQAKPPVKPATAGTEGDTTKPGKTTSTKPPIAQEVKSTATTASSTGSQEDALKKELGDAIRSWQQHKKVVLRERQTSELSKYLTGRALVNQTNAVKWLTDNKNYYEMTPKGVTVDRIQKLSESPKRYSVVVNVKEQSKQIRESDKGVVKSTDDSYNVNYTLEKSDDTWRIADYKLLSTTKK